MVVVGITFAAAIARNCFLNTFNSAKYGIYAPKTPAAKNITYHDFSIPRYNEEVKIEDFKAEVWEQGRKLYREMPWREDTRPYYVLVSELMLQQTQVDRVVSKFRAFIAVFPNEEVLADASLAEVLKLWSGLGYNRRAKFLHEAAKKIVKDFKGEFPHAKEELL